MENISYEKDYTPSVSRTTESLDRKARLICGITRRMARLYEAIPRMENPFRRAAYEQALKLCDRYAREHGGSVKGLIDFSTYDVTITVVLPSFEFQSSEDSDLLSSFQLADLTSFRCLEDGNMELLLFFNCFDLLWPTKEADIEAFLTNDPDVQTMIAEGIWDCPTGEA